MDVYMWILLDKVINNVIYTLFSLEMCKIDSRKKDYNLYYY